MKLNLLPLVVGAALLAGCSLLRPPLAPAVPPPAPVIDNDAVQLRAALAYQEALKQMSSAELATEAARLAVAPTSPRSGIEQAMLLLQTRGTGDLAHAVGLLDGIAHDPQPDAKPYRSLARLMLAMVTDQRRLEEQVERQGQQLREQQKKLDQLNDKLEALKAIEHSLSRPAATAGTSHP